MGKLNLVRRGNVKLGRYFEPLAIAGGTLVATSIAVIFASLTYVQGQNHAERTALEATGFVGCGKKGEPMMRMPLQECAALKAFLASHSGQGTYVVYTDAPPPAPTR